jgi:two-component system, LuxR family, sensor histidine kinase DctS
LRRMTGDGEQIILSALDVEAQKEAERQVQAAFAQSQENSRLAALGTMALGVAHEINNPLQVMRNLGTLLRESAMPVNSQARLLDKMDRAVSRITSIVAALRSFARDGHADPAALVNVKELVTEVVDLVRTVRPKDDAQILIGEMSDQLLVECRETEIGQVLLNLVLNALDAIRDSNERWIRIEVAEVGEDAEFSVTDSGTGIPPDLVDKIMLPFFTTKTGTGTGLGLSISRSIVERYGGSLAVDLTSAQTRFVVRIPKRVAASATASEQRRTA